MITNDPLQTFKIFSGIQMFIMHDDNELSDEVKFRFLCLVLLSDGIKDDEQW